MEVTRFEDVDVADPCLEAFVDRLRNSAMQDGHLILAGAVNYRSLLHVVWVGSCQRPLLQTIWTHELGTVASAREAADRYLTQWNASRTPPLRRPLSESSRLQSQASSPSAGSGR